MAEQEAGDRTAVEKEARQLGWVPETEFRGDKARWVDADVFVERGHSIMPILKQNNARLQGDVDRLTGDVGTLKAALREATAAMEDLKRHNEETARERVKEVKKELLAQLKAAKKDEDFDAEVEITDRLTEVNASLREPPKPAVNGAAKDEKPAVDPEFAAWQAAPGNEWFGVDRRRTSLAIGVAQELRADPKNAGLVGKAFFDRVAEEVAATLNPASEPAKDRVEGGRGSGGAAGSGTRAKSYADLPAEAKAACDSQAKRFAGKPGFKDEAAYRTHYVNIYFGDEA